MDRLIEDQLEKAQIRPDATDVIEAVARRLSERGEFEDAKELLRAVKDIRQDVPQKKDLLTTGQAATKLEVSASTVKRWIREGRLIGHRRGGWVQVSKRSVDALIKSSALADERESEARLTRALDPFRLRNKNAKPYDAGAEK